MRRRRLGLLCLVFTLDRDGVRYRAASSGLAKNQARLCATPNDRNHHNSREVLGVSCKSKSRGAFVQTIGWEGTKAKRLLGSIRLTLLLRLFSWSGWCENTTVDCGA